MKTQESFFEQDCGTYTQVGDVLLPNLVIEEAEQTQAQMPIGNYGHMRKRYLKEHRPALYFNMLLAGKLIPHLAEIDQACEERLELIVRQMAEREGVTEVLKASDQMEWVAHMNNIRSRAEELVLHELIYTEEVEDADT